MTLEELLALHNPLPQHIVHEVRLCGCGRKFDTGQERINHLADVIHAGFVLVPRPSPVLGEPLVESSVTGHLAFVAFPATDDLMDRVSADARVLANEISKAFER